MHPLPNPNQWQGITDPDARLHVGLTQLYEWFEASEPVMTNSVRDFGAVQESAEAMQPVGEVFQRIYEMLCQGWEGSRGSPLLSLAVDFAIWTKLRREQGMASSATYRCGLTSSAACTPNLARSGFLPASSDGHYAESSCVSALAGQESALTRVKPETSMNP